MRKEPVAEMYFSEAGKTNLVYRVRVRVRVRARAIELGLSLETFTPHLTYSSMSSRPVCASVMLLLLSNQSSYRSKRLKSNPEPKSPFTG